MPLSISLYLFWRGTALLNCLFFSLRRLSSCETRGCIQKANIPRDISRDANTYRLFTRRAIFEAIRQSDIWETFVSRRAYRTSIVFGTRKGEEIPPRLFVLPARQASLLKRNRSWCEASTGSTNDKSQWSVEASISSCSPHNFDVEGSVGEMQM